MQKCKYLILLTPLALISFEGRYIFLTFITFITFFSEKPEIIEQIDVKKAFYIASIANILVVSLTHIIFFILGLGTSGIFLLGFTVLILSFIFITEYQLYKIKKEYKIKNTTNILNAK